MSIVVFVRVCYFGLNNYSLACSKDLNEYTIVLDSCITYKRLFKPNAIIDALMGSSSSASANDQTQLALILIGSVELHKDAARSNTRPALEPFSSFPTILLATLHKSATRLAYWNLHSNLARSPPHCIPDTLDISLARPPTPCHYPKLVYQSTLVRIHMVSDDHHVEKKRTWFANL